MPHQRRGDLGLRLLIVGDADAAKIASSSVGGSRRTRRGPYLVFQSSLIAASPIP
jgi:hypothetical protein